MPPAPTFDCYSALGVEKTAAQKDITAAYRQLARVHHPDKNPDNVEEATAAFQKIQLAYETLSDPAGRAQYDARVSSQASGQPPHPYPNFWPQYSSNYAEAQESRFADVHMHDFFASYNAAGGWRRQSRSFCGGNHSWDDIRRGVDELHQMQRQRENRAKCQAARKRDREEAKKREEEAKEKERNEQQVVEKSNQEARWKALNALTKDERVEACLHSQFCSKTQHQRKFKCQVCSVKRSKTAYECPYCGLFLCLTCVLDFIQTRRRTAEHLTHKPKPTPMFTSARTYVTESETEQEPAPEPEPEPEPEPKPEPKRELKQPGSARDSTAVPKPKHKNAAHDENHNAKAKPYRAAQKQTGSHCYNCGKVGHIARNCHEEPKSSPRRCHNCGEQGHFIRNCPYNDQQPHGYGRNGKRQAERQRR